MSRLNRKMSYEKRIAAKRFHLVAGMATLAMAATGNAHAALIGVTQTFPDTTLTASPYLVYDHNAVNASTGLLTIYTGASTLNEGAGAGGSSVTQAYLGASDTIPDLMMQIQINNSTGAWLGGSVGITYGNVAANPRFAWTGNITNFGFQNDGKLFDATWNVTNDQYQNMPGTLSQFINGYLTGSSGGIKFSNSYGFGTGSFASDWIFGSSAATTTALNSYITGLDAGFLRANSTVTADVFTTPVPLPAAIWLLGSGLLALGRISLRSKSGTEQV
jgi:hypothetical protein